MAIPDITDYSDVLSALRAAGFRYVQMVGSGGIDVISVALIDSAAEGPELLIGENADMLDLPPREDLTGWRILFRPDDQGDIVVYAGGPDDAVMVRRAVDFASANAFLPPNAEQGPKPEHDGAVVGQDPEAPFSRDRVLAVEQMLFQADKPENKTPEQEATRDALMHAWCMLSGQDERTVTASLKMRGV